MPKLNQKGIIAQVLMLVVLAAGLVGGLYLVQHPTFFKPKAGGGGTNIAVVDASGNQISNTTSQNVKVKLTYAVASPSPTSSPSSDSRLRAFVTSTAYDGNLNSNPGASQKCQDRANAANLGGVWDAWLQSSTVLKVGNTYKSLKGDTVISYVAPGIGYGTSPLSIPTKTGTPINITELGTVSSEPYVWSYIKGNGQVINESYQDSCNRFSSTSGMGRVGRITNGDWTDANTTTLCSNKLPLYCFEQAPSSPTPASFPTAFRLANDNEGLLSSATEQTFDSNGKIVDWTLSSGVGPKLIYSQFKVNGVWEAPLSASITYSSSTSPTPSSTPSSANPSLSIDKTNAEVSDTVTVSWTGSKFPLDWVGLYSVNTAPLGANDFLDWKYTGNCSKDKNTTNVVASGSCTFSLPSKAAGEYNFRMFANNTNTYIATSPVLVIKGASLTFDLSASWSGSQSPLDWVGIYTVGADDNSFLDWKYTGNCSKDKNTTKVVISGTCNFTVPKANGTYEFRIFSNNTNTKITTSPHITVAP